MYLSTNYSSYFTDEYAKCYSELFGHMFLFLWNFILRALYINKIILFVMACNKWKRKECYFKCYTFCERADGVYMWGFK